MADLQRVFGFDEDVVNRSAELFFSIFSPVATTRFWNGILEQICMIFSKIFGHYIQLIKIISCGLHASAAQISSAAQINAWFLLLDLFSSKKKIIMCRNETHRLQYSPIDMTSMKPLYMLRD